MFNMSKKITSILLVDDDMVIDYLHKKLLFKAGIVAPITTLFNGRQAIDKLVTLNDQLSSDDCLTILLDLNMPILDGWGFLEELDSIFTIFKFKIELFIVSSSNNPDDITKAKKNKYVIDYIPKPLTPESINKYIL